MTDRPEEQTLPARRAREIAEATVEESTAIARRRRREPRPVGGPPREVAAPPVIADVYGVRPAQPGIAVRAAAPTRVAQAPVDGRAIAAEHRRRARRTALIVLAAASGLVLAAAASLLMIAPGP